MATFTITLPDDKVEGLVEAFAVLGNYQENITDPQNPEATIPNPVGKPRFAKNSINLYLRQIWNAHKVKPLDDSREAVLAEGTEETKDFDVV